MSACVAVLAVVIAACQQGDTGGAAAGPPECAEVEAFAERLVDIGIIYDYEPSSGPADLAEWIDVVVLGTLTGEVTAGRGPTATSATRSP